MRAIIPAIFVSGGHGRVNVATVLFTRWALSTYRAGKENPGTDTGAKLGAWEEAPEPWGLRLRLPARKVVGERGCRRQESGHLLFDQLMLLHRGGKHDLRELVSPCLPARIWSLPRPG